MMGREETDQSNIDVIDATAKDIDGIKEVQAVTWLATYPNEEIGISREGIEEYLNSPARHEKYEKWKETINKSDNEHTFVAKENDRVVGFCSTSKEKENRVQAIYVLPEYQGKDIGRKLMDSALKWFPPEKDIYVNVASYNNDAIKFYRRFGFAESGKDVTDNTARLPSGKVIPELEMVREYSPTLNSLK